MQRRFNTSTVTLDLVSLALGVAVASWSVFGTPLIWNASIPPGSSVWPMLIMIAAGAVASSYMNIRLWAQAAPRPSYGRALAMVSLTLGVVAVGIVLTRAYFSRPFIGLTGAWWFLSMVTHRMVRRRRPWTELMVLVTAEKGLAGDLDVADHTEVLTILDPQSLPPEEPLPEGTSLVIDLRSVLSEEMAGFVSSSDLAGYTVRSLTNVYEEHTGRLALVHLADGWEISTPVRRKAGYMPMKRALDLLLAVVTSPLWLLLGLVVWLVVKTDSRGPGIYKQVRIGYRNAPFTLYKFRTMVWEPGGGNGPSMTVPDDDRRTRAGRLLRRARLDEIPQLVNVLRGDLSLVGPRPEQVRLVRGEGREHGFEETIPFYAYRHLVRPGITGWAQINCGYANTQAETVEKLTYDLYYVKHMSPWLDFRILGDSLWTVLTGRGAR